MVILLRNAGYNVTVLTAMPNYPTGRIFPGYRGRLMHRDVLDGITVIRLWLAPSNSRSLLRRGLSLVTHLGSLFFTRAARLVINRSDLVIVSSPPLASAALAAMLAKAGRKKILVNISDIWPLTAAAMGALHAGPTLNLLLRAELRLYKCATAFSGQSLEILDHLAASSPAPKPTFLYRNLQNDMPFHEGMRKPAASPLKIIYAGNLGHAQGLLKMVKAVDFKLAGAELHIYGDGGEGAALRSFLQSNPDTGIHLHAPIPQIALDALLGEFHFVLVPLKVPIPGAVPSKLFMAVAAGLPVLFCAGGEGELLVREHGLGLIVAPGDYAALVDGVQKAVNMDAAEYERMCGRVLAARSSVFSKSLQDEKFIRFVAQIVEDSDSV